MYQHGLQSIFKGTLSVVLKDILPLGQSKLKSLVPEPTLQHGVDLDSDDDTFCQSNRISNDDISHLSDSNSKMWESGDSSESSRDRTSHIRISSRESLSSLAEHEEVKDRSISDDIGSSMNPFGFQETEISYNPEALMAPFEPSPLPPLQWRVSRTQTDPLEGQETTPPSFMRMFVDSKGPRSVFHHPPTPATDDLIHRVSGHVNVTANKHSGEQNLKANAQKKLNQAGNVRRVDEHRMIFCIKFGQNHSTLGRLDC